jgi:hypothetical protein
VLRRPLETARLLGHNPEIEAASSQKSNTSRRGSM